MGMKRVGTAFFAVGMVIAVLLGATAYLFISQAIMAFFWLLVLLGLVTGFLNTGKEDAEDILYTGAVILLACIAAGELSRTATPVFGSFVTGAAKGIIAFVLPIVLVVGAKRVWDTGTGF